ncbi:hypothetical protein SAMN05720758_1750 [Fibrobacter sp. UWB11]|nr:hypothetical protein SAMN05720758_1750 [Fibrobacter sp. UWB11]
MGKNLEKLMKFMKKKLEVAICVLKHALSILSIQVFKGKPLRRSFNKHFIYTHQLRSVLF